MGFILAHKVSLTAIVQRVSAASNLPEIALLFNRGSRVLQVISWHIYT